MENQRGPATTMDSSSASSTVADPINSSSGDYSHDVFINHRGPDTKKTFASHLYSRLLLHGFRPFLDQQELQVGRNFPSQIVGAIRNATVHVAIFSPNYADSQWCLDELLLMLESRAPIIPVFYNVEPAELRWTDQNKNGVYAKALTKFQMNKTDGSQTHREKPRYDSATIQKWRNALSTVANTSGFDLKGKFNGDEGAMLDKVVDRVVKIIAKKTRLYVAKYPTGLDDKVNDFETTVLRQQHTDIAVVGIVGWGGVGKTTLAKEFFNRKRSGYNKSCFLSDVRENAKSSLLSLQSRLLKDLSQLDRHINNTHQGTEMLRQFLSSSQVLLVLDDIDHEDQVDALLPDRDVLLSNILILITSRDKGALARSGVEDSSIYKLKGLTPQHSRELFCSYAFHQPYPVRGFKDLVDKFLEASDGLPLLLKVFGALLFGKNNKSYWEETLLQVPTDIQKRLKISYDALSEEEQGIFLDIAYFFIGAKKDTAIRVWKGSGWKGLLGFQNLESKCLVEVDSDNYIHMHDHLRDLGIQIGEKELPRRLWCPTENIDDWMHQDSFVITEARGIRMLPDRNSSKGGTRSQMLSWNQRSSREQLGNCVMKLQLLQTEGHLFDHILRRVPSQNLIWLSWSNYPYSYLPSWIPIKNLRVLKVEGRLLETLWQEESQAPWQLQELEIIDAKHLSNIPRSIGQLKHLERIVIFCSSLSKLPEEIHLLKLLRTLVLRKSSLKSLPDSFGNLTNLQHVNLSWCKKLERLPDSFGSLRNLQHMDLSYCTELERLPDSFGSLTNLHHMDLSYCSELERLPDSFGNLTNLHYINLVECQKLQRLPDSFGSLRNLHHMDLSYCIELVRLPDSFGSLTNLHHINLVECEKLERLPDSFGSLMNLYHMDLSYCTELERLPDSFGSLTNLHHINLVECEKLKRLPDSFGSLTSLHHINLVECKKLERLPATFGNLTKLHHLDLSYCSELERLPDAFGSLTDLHHMDLSRCKKLEKLPDSLSNLKNLQHIDLSCCYELERLPDSFGSLRNLHHIKLSLCRKLERLPDSFGSLTKLHHINLFGCGELKRLPDCFCNLTNLHYIDLSYCTELERLPDSFGSLTNLHHINLAECERLERLPDSLGSLMNVHHMDLSRCKNLDKLPDSFGNLTNLQHMDLSFCEKLERLPDSFGSLISLKHLRLSCCSNLTISSDTLGNIRTLEGIDLSGCKKMEEWTSQLAHQMFLKTLKLTGTNLKELPSAIGVLRDLEVLWIGSPLLDTLPPSLGDLRNLKDLRFEDCRGLKCLPASVGRLSQLTKLEVAGCPIMELPFKKVKGQSETVPPLKSDFSIHKYMPLLQCLLLQDTEISEISFGEGVYPNLQHLILNECNNLVEVGTLPNTLIQVDLRSCYNLRNIERLCCLAKLQILNIERCNELHNLSNIKTLVSLEQLNAVDCVKLKSIRDLAQLTKLETLNVRGCVELEELEGVEYCISLRGIYAGRCPKLQWGERVVERLLQSCVFTEL